MYTSWNPALIGQGGYNFTRTTYQYNMERILSALGQLWIQSGCLQQCEQFHVLCSQGDQTDGKFHIQFLAHKMLHHHEGAETLPTTIQCSLLTVFLMHGTSIQQHSLQPWCTLWSLKEFVYSGNTKYIYSVSWIKIFPYK